VGKQKYAGSLPAQPQKMYSSQPELNNNWTKASQKKLKEKPNTGSIKLSLPIALLSSTRK
jgi:hypothetical protein